MIPPNGDEASPNRRERRRLSFFDEGDEPRRPRPRRPAGGVAAPPDPHTARIRQGVAAGVILLVVILLVVGIKGCLNSAKKRSMRDYNRDVSALVQESDDQVSKPFFEALSGGGAASGDTVNLATQVNQLKIVAEDLVKRARKLDAPDDMKPAQRYLLDVLEFRADALKKIADKIPTAQSTGNASETAVPLALPEDWAVGILSAIFWSASARNSRTSSR